MALIRNFEGRVALITGAGGGIGRTLALRLSELGFRLALLGRSMDKLRAVAEAAGQAEGALLIPGDLTEPTFVQGVIGRVVENFGRLDVLVNNAGICFFKNM